MVSIRSVIEQEFLTNWLFNTLSIETNVWTGARRLNEGEEFVWTDGSELSYTNWTEGSPTNNSKRNCVALESGLARNILAINDKENKLSTSNVGSWRDQSCEVGNYVLCEKLQSWSLAQLQQIVLKTRAELQESQSLLRLTTAELESAKNKLDKTASTLESTVSDLAETKNKMNRVERNPGNT